jgi:hypothetical protein
MSRGRGRRDLALEKLAPLHRAIASQAEVLSEIEKEVPNYLDATPRLALMAADTVIFENYSNPAQCLAWLTAALREWLKANERFNDMVGTSIFYRYIVLPFPTILQNPYKRHILVETILLHVHLQLWHGVICGVIFADPRRVDVNKVVQILNFLAMPVHNVFYDVPNFYRLETLRKTFLQETSAARRIEDVRSFVTSQKQKPIWLYYDEQNFGGNRLKGWRWEALREFFRSLYGPRLVCSGPGCGKDIGEFALDHIAPVSKKYFQTVVNFRPLCKPCNRLKSDLVGEDPFRPWLRLPEEYQTRELDDIYRQRPPWLGKLTRPGSREEVLARNLGLG